MQCSAIWRDQTRDQEAVPRGDADFADEVFRHVTHRCRCGIVAWNLDYAGKGRALAGNRTTRQMLRDGAIETQRLGKNQRAADANAPAVEEMPLEYSFTHR